MPSSSRNSCILYAPVTAVSIGLQRICFAIGNRVLEGDADVGSSSDFQVAAELPHGAVITALEQHAVSDLTGALDIILLIGSGDSVFVANSSSQEGRSGGSHLSQFVLDDMARVLRLRSLGQGGGALAVTAMNSAYLIREETLCSVHTSATPPLLVRYAVTGLGVALAADAVVVRDDAAMAVFTGTYAGSIAVWRVPPAGTRGRNNEEETGITHGAVNPISWIIAHRPGCAVFAVKVTILRDIAASDHVRFCVATCSDDRTATLYVSNSVPAFSSMMEGMRWKCCWRGVGASFSRRRVFDVSLLLIAEHGGMLLLATGGEDGSVQVFGFPSQELIRATTTLTSPTEAAEGEVAPVAPVRLLHRGHQHDGRGVYKVALLRNPASDATAVVSCGFDGAVHHTPVSPCPGRSAMIVLRNVQPRRHVRGVLCDNEGSFLACTEDELIVFLQGATAKEQRLPIPITGTKKELPSCLSVAVGSCWRRRQQYLLTLLGTTGGKVYGMWYSSTGAQPQCQKEEDEEVEMRDVVVLLHASASQASKVLLVRGILRQERVLLVSVHASGVLIVLEVDPFHGIASKVWMTSQCAGVHTTTLSMCMLAPQLVTQHEEYEQQKQQQGQDPELQQQYLCLFVGDDDGCISVDLVQTMGDACANTNLLPRERLFQGAIASVTRQASHMKGPCERITVVSAQGEVRVLLLHVGGRNVDILPVSSPLRLPWRISSVLAYSETVAVTLFGTDISVYRRHPSRFSWYLVAEYHGVRAPRLLSATISTDLSGVGGIPVFVCHCSDGVQAEWFTCDALSGTRILLGGAIIGREYNTTLFLPSPASAVICGGENSMLTAFSLPYSSQMCMDTPVAFTGPHDSNILAMATCAATGDSGSVRFVTVGGLATLALWEWSMHHSWRVIAHVGQHRESVAGGEAEGRGVPRFLSVCVTCEDIVVGGSDGKVRLFSLSEGLQLRRKVLLCASTPKPVMAVATLSAKDRLVVMGDTNGVLGVCGVADGSVTARLTWARSAVNAIAVGRQLQPWLQQQDGPRQMKTEEGNMFAVWRVLVAMDSGEVALLHVGVSAIEMVCAVRVGLTAARGVCWIPGLPRDDADTDVAVTVNDERLACLFIREVSEATGRTEMLYVAWHTRVNVRGVSGLAVASLMERSLCAVVVGEGVEVVSLPTYGST
ncbi:hypothetical protein TraAM80_03862 [Trypanosoma rangeli]|uniref:Uncharacterized protein n=1 Tax=Trypanosoma rangeli TaxID=5698 RepID=A0A422NM69_TRYRA|nr:uncharacterized protein TraAM80_03862 [Trypanosoma rangeli]RNF06592.1 hypothetical protein TraAM80_03862 [Trypanosoma rangeli]|eukprot:RNF06592.1 hypothetical protein TraAM80_03862 [Trypanosoma rangeli]